MFDAGFSELLLIFVIALIVIGPERLPGVARKVGYWVGKARSYFNSVRSDIERELRADELRQMLAKQEQEIRELKDMMRETTQDLQQEAKEATQEAEYLVKAIGDETKPVSSEPASPPPSASEGAPVSGPVNDKRDPS